MLPAVGLLVHLLPFEADDVDEQALGEAVATDDRGGDLTPLVGEAEAAVVEQLGVAVVDQAVDGLGDRRRRQTEPLDQPGPDRHRALLLDLEDGFEILLGRVVPFGHAGSLAREGPTVQRRPPDSDGFVRPLREGSERKNLHSRLASANMVSTRCL